MTWALVGIVGALTTVVAVLSGATWWSSKKAIDSVERLIAFDQANVDLKAQLDRAKTQQETTIATLKNVQRERDRQGSAMQLLRKQLEAALEQADNDPVATTARIRDSLERLRALSTEVPDVPGPESDEDG